MNIYLTLDYELFMGIRPGTVENCLIQPMDAFDAILNRYGIKASLFVDSAYLYRLNELRSATPDLEKDYRLVTDNIKKLHESGHDIQFHFHPQWLFSEFADGKWKMDFAHYKLGDLPNEQVEKVFKASKNLLDSVTGKVSRAFRAGGYSLQSYENYTKLFKDNDIIVDSSVLRNAREKSQFQWFDFTNLPNKHLYRFCDDITCESPDGEFYELTISSVKYMGFRYLFLRWYSMWKHRNAVPYGDGIGIQSAMGTNNRIKQIIGKLCGHTVVPVSMDIWLSFFSLPKRIRRIQGCEDDNLVLLGHPKNFTNESLNNLDKFISRALDSNYKFKTYTDLINNLSRISAKP